MSALMNESLFKKTTLILGIGRLVTTEYRGLPSIRYSAEPSNRTEYWFSLSNWSTWTASPSFLCYWSVIVLKLQLGSVTHSPLLVPPPGMNSSWKSRWRDQQWR